MSTPYPGIEARTRADGTRVYRATVYDRRTRKRHRKTFTRLAEAKRWKADADRQIAAGIRIADRGPTLAEAADEWIRLARAGVIRTRSGHPYKPAAIRGYEQALRLRVLPEFGALRLRDIARTDIQRWVERMALAGLAPSTIDTTLNPLRRIYARALALGEVATNPTSRIETPAIIRRPKWIPDVALCLDLLDALEPQDRPVWATAMFAGLRRGELVGLHGEDVDLASGVIRVRRGWDQIEGEIPPKSAQGRRTVPIVALLRDELDAHCARKTIRDDGPFFGTLSQVLGCYERARDTWRQRGLRPVTFHDCRHAAASFFIASGGNAKAVSTVMGHASIAITFDLYGHLLPGAEDELRGLMDGFLADALSDRTAPNATPDGSDSPISTEI